MKVRAPLPFILLPIFIFILGMKEAAAISSSAQSQSSMENPEEASSHVVLRHHYGATTPPTTTQVPVMDTTISLDPHTSISVHTIVRNKPVYLPPQTQRPTSYTSKEDYSYTYEDVSDAESVKTLTIPTTKPPRSFWSSQKATMDSRRLSANKKYPGYHKQVDSDARIPSKTPVIEFKKRERPKFGLSKKPFVLSPNSKTTESTTTTTTTSTRATTPKPIQNEPIYKTDFGKDFAVPKTEDKSESEVSNIKSNDIVVGRVGEMPIQQPLAAQTQSQFRQEQLAQVAGSRQSKFDDTVHSAVPHQNYLQTPRQNDPNPPLPGNIFISAALPQTTNNQQVRNNAPISASNAAAGQLPANTLLSRLGSLGLGNLRAGGGGGGLKLPGGNGFTVNLGPVPDPITFILRLLSLIPRPLLNLNSRLFFGIELGSNAGLVSGSGPKAG